MEILFLCNTYMQVINVIQIRTKLFPNEVADIAISDHSNSSQQICERLKKEDVFDKVIYLKTHYIIFEQSKLSDILDVIELSIGRSSKFEKILSDMREGYDYIFYYNCEYILELIYDKSIKSGKIPKFVCFEEGLSSYLHMKLPITGGRWMFLYLLRKLQRKLIVQNATMTYYCYYPNLFNSDIDDEVIEIPKLQKEDRELVELLNRIFDYSDSDEYKVKYIYFGMAPDNPWKMNMDDVCTVIDIANKVGKNNFILKKHPRDKRTVYEQNGIRVMKASSIPWEVIQLNNDFENQVFITTFSGSIFTASAILGDNIEAYILFPSLEGNNKEFDEFCNINFKEKMYSLQKEGVCLRHRFVLNISEIPFN